MFATRRDITRLYLQKVQAHFAVLWLADDVKFLLQVMLLDLPISANFRENVDVIMFHLLFVDKMWYFQIWASLYLGIKLSY